MIRIDRYDLLLLKNLGIYVRLKRSVLFDKDKKKSIPPTGYLSAELRTVLSIDIVSGDKEI